MSRQWDAFKHLEAMVFEGKIAMPRQVINELTKIVHPDLPGAWAPGVRDLQKHPLDADFDHIRHVMAVAGDVADVHKTEEDADPWVLALALQLVDIGLETCIVTEDVVDRTSISIATACGKLDLQHTRVRPFLEHCGIDLLKPRD